MAVGSSWSAMAVRGSVMVEGDRGSTVKRERAKSHKEKMKEKGRNNGLKFGIELFVQNCLFVVLFCFFK